MSTQINVYNDGAEELVQRMRRTRILDMTEKYKKAIDSFSCIIYIANDTAGFAIFDAMTHLKKSPLYRQKVKKTAKRCKPYLRRISGKTPYNFPRRQGGEVIHGSCRQFPEHNK